MEGWLAKLVAKRVPVVGWLGRYDRESAIADLVAGLTVGLTVMPQGLAYASIAGLPTQYGLYSAFMGCFVYAILGGCKDITIGPTALMSLMTYDQVLNRNPDYAVLLCFLTGCVMLLMAPLRLGVLVEFISEPVTVGFTSATSIIIIASQLKGLLGLQFSSSGFPDTVYQAARALPRASLPDAATGLICLAILLGMRKLKDINVIDKLKPTKQQKFLAKTLWVLSISRNALVVLLCSVMAYLMEVNMEEVPIQLTGTVRSGLPPLAVPPFGTTLGNTTLSFQDMVQDLGSSIILVPVIAVLGNVAIAKAFATGGGLDACQELLTLGLCNVLGSFVSSMPVTGSFSRSAVNHASGVRTPLGGVITGGVILLALGVLTPYFFYIPKASLAAVIIGAVIFMIEYQVIKPLWRVTKKELVPLTVTLLACLLIGVEIGILAGVVANLCLLLAHSARPRIVLANFQLACGMEYTKVTPESCVFYPGVENLRKQLTKAAQNNQPVVLDCSNMRATDYTTAKEMAGILKEMNRKDQALIFLNASVNVLQVFKETCGENLKHTATERDLNTRIMEVHRGGVREDGLGVASVEMGEAGEWARAQANGDAPDSALPLLQSSKPIILVKSS